MLEVKRAPEGLAYLNLACGDTYYAEWNNCDQLPRNEVAAVDLRNPLPWPDASFDAIYSSHLLEHLSPADAEQFLKRLQRIGKPGAVLRIVIPDMEGICRLYLQALEQQANEPSEEGGKRYRWMVIELLDQLVRQQPGGEMAKALRAGDFDARSLATRFADSFRHYGESDLQAVPRNGRSDEPNSFARQRDPLGLRLRRGWIRFKSRLFERSTDPRVTGEAHKWMYDRYSLAELLEACGYVDVRLCDVSDSSIPNWSKYNLDISRFGDTPRKPDSLYMEARVPGDSA